MVPKHQRSKSFPDKRAGEGGVDDSHEDSLGSKLEEERFKGAFQTKKQQSPRIGTQNSLKREILQLEKRLQSQFAVHGALEKALGSGSVSHGTDEPASISKPTTVLIKEIAVLELEVTYLEQYLLSLYRKAFDHQISSVSPRVKDRSLKCSLITPRRLFADEDATQTATKFENSTEQSTSKSISCKRKENREFTGGVKIPDSNVQRCHSSLSYRATVLEKSSSNSLSEALRVCHSQPLSMSQYSSSNVISLAEHLGTRISDHVPESPNRISEEMVKCMAAIFSKLAEPPSANNGLLSPNSSSHSMGAFSPRHQCDVWSPGFGKYSSFDTQLDNPFDVEGLKEFSGPYSSMVEVQCLHREPHKFGDVEDMLQHFRSLISRLQEVDPKKMTHEEKLAFWINVHNALVMHAFLAYGIPKNNVKRVFLLLKAAYNVGGHPISADTIQSTILSCRMSRPAQWLRMFLTPRTKFKTADDRQAYVIERPEPLLHFALSSGSHSDPALRVYTPKKVLQELEAAKDEYIRATFGVRKDKKVTLPKVVDSYAKELGLCSAGITEMIDKSLPDSLRKTLKKCQSSKSRKTFEWTPHVFSFRYLISKELLK